MIVSTKNVMLQEYFAHECELRFKVTEARKHNEERVRVFHEADRVFENRKLAGLEHEQLKIKNDIALGKEADEKMLFLKRTLGLNII